MRKFLQIIKQWPRWARLTFWAGGSLLLFLIFFWSLWSWFLSGVAWLSLPLELRAKVAYAKLAASSYRELSCHEHCLIERRFYRQIVASSTSRTMKEKIAKAITDESENQSFRIELIRALALLNPAVKPDYITTYLASDPGNLEIKQTIIEEFAPESNPSAIAGFKKIITDFRESESRRLQAMDSLALLGGESYAPFFLNILEDEENLRLCDRSISILNSFEHPESWLEKESFNHLVEILNNSETDNHLRRRLAKMLSIYFDINRGDLEKVYINALDNQAVDKFTKAYLIEFLNRRTGSKYELPEISADEWSNYAEGAIEARPLDDKTFQ